MSERESDIDWKLVTWEGSRREQLRRWRQLTLRERFAALEDMSRVSDAIAEARAQGKFNKKM